jgi:hypothetical protein
MMKNVSHLDMEQSACILTSKGDLTHNLFCIILDFLL